MTDCAHVYLKSVLIASCIRSWIETNYIYESPFQIKSTNRIIKPFCLYRDGFGYQSRVIPTHQPLRGFFLIGMRFLKFFKTCSVHFHIEHRY